MDAETEFNEGDDDRPQRTQKFLFLRFAQVGIVEQCLVFVDVDGEDGPRRCVEAPGEAIATIGRVFACVFAILLIGQHLMPLLLLYILRM